MNNLAWRSGVFYCRRATKCESRCRWNSYYNSSSAWTSGTRRLSGSLNARRDSNTASDALLQESTRYKVLSGRTTHRDVRTFKTQKFCENQKLLDHSVWALRKIHSPSGVTSDGKEAGQLPQYEAPTNGPLSYFPKAVVPYAELSRLDKPAGAIYLFFPCAFSTLLAAPLAYPSLGALQVLSTMALFFSGAVVMRAAGCTINDLWDRDLDPHVSRTRLRPIARGAIKPQAALVYTGAQLLTGLAVLLQFPNQCLWYGIPSLALVTTYPLAKRVTNYPQVVLGLAFSWGAIMGFPALNIDLTASSDFMMAAFCLYLSCVSWTVLYDMIYAHMDIKDDVKAGIKSIALRHEKNTKSVLTGLAVVQIGLLAAAGSAVGAGPMFFAGSCGGSALTLGLMIWKVNLKNVRSCWWWFRNGCWSTGGVITLGLACEYASQILRYERDSNEVSSAVQDNVSGESEV